MYLLARVELRSGVLQRQLHFKATAGHPFHTLTALSTAIHCVYCFVLFFTWIRVHWSALKKDCGSSVAQRAIYHIAVPCDPANVCNAAKDISIMVVKHILQESKRCKKWEQLPPHPMSLHNICWVKVIYSWGTVSVLENLPTFILPVFLPFNISCQTCLE